MRVLREGLLADYRIALSGSVSDALRDELARLGAVIGGEHVQALVHDAGEDFRARGLTDALARTWSAIASTANEALIPDHSPAKVVLIAPRADAGEHASAARSALENLVRTLSTEWARYQITTAAIAPGRDTSDEEIAALVCFVISRAGDYFSGCRFDLGSTSSR